jgi:PEP-CTERM motif
MLSFLVLTAGSAQANPIRFADVIAQAVATGTGDRQTFDLRLRTLPQDGRLGSTQPQTPASTNTSNPDQTQTQTPTSGNGGSVTNTEVQTTPGQSGNVETVQVGDVTGTVCDCGEILIPGGHFPKLPFLALGGIPFFFINHHKPPTEEFPTPTPTPPTTPTPEPTTLLLLGSGLVAIGAGARRRRARQLHRTVELPSAGEV